MYIPIKLKVLLCFYLMVTLFHSLEKFWTGSQLMLIEKVANRSTEGTITLEAKITLNSIFLRLATLSSIAFALSLPFLRTVSPLRLQ